MADLGRDIRLAVDTGKVAIGAKEAAKAINADSAKLVIVASRGMKEAVADMLHTCKVAGVKVIKFEGSAMELGATCGKPYSINAMAVLEPGNSNILSENY
ncbi:MAG: 50S ribosomal protein L30e [Candidatus Micrarchaeia archaeon]